MKKYTLYIIFFLVLFLQGCYTPVIIGTSTLITKGIGDPRSIGEQIDDIILKIKIEKIVYQSTKNKKNVRIIPTIYKNRVLLTGQCKYEYIINSIKKKIYKIKNVIEIFDEIIFTDVISSKEKLVDYYITLKIYYNFLIEKPILLNQIKVVTEKREVYLLGIISHLNAKLALNISNNIKNINHVTTIFTYK